MMEFLRDGGFSMWFVILFAGLTLAAAISFARKADLRKVAVIRALTSATVFAILTGLSTNFLAVMRALARMQDVKSGLDLAQILMQGLGESVTVAVLGFAVLAVTWLVVAVGTRRARDDVA